MKIFIFGSNFEPFAFFCLSYVPWKEQANALEGIITLKQMHVFSQQKRGNFRSHEKIGVQSLRPGKQWADRSARKKMGPISILLVPKIAANLSERLSKTIHNEALVFPRVCKKRLFEPTDRTT